MNSKIITLIQSGQFKQALIEFDLALKKTPHDAQLWSNRGVVLNTVGSTDPGKRKYIYIPKHSA